MHASGSLGALVVVADDDLGRAERWRARAVPFVDIAVAGTVADAMARLGGDGIDAVLVDAGRTGPKLTDVLERLKPIANGRPVMLVASSDAEEGPAALAAAAVEAGVAVVQDGGPADLCRSLRHVVAECRRYEFVSRNDRLEPVTGLDARQAFLDAVGHGVRRTNGASAVTVLDIDGFAAVNQLVGRDAADQVLASLAHRLMGALGETELLGAAGGGRFLHWTPIDLCPEDALSRARRLLDVISRPLVAAGQRLQLTASAGIALFPADAVSVETLVGRAEATVHRAKAVGPDTYRLHQPLLVGLAPAHMRKRAAIRRELDRDALELVFEPQLDLRTERPRAARLALRTCADGALLKLAPDEIDELAVPMIRWTLDSAGAQMASWLAREVPLVPLVIDLPLKLVHRSDVVDMVRRRLQSAGCHPAWFEVAVPSDEGASEITADATAADHLQALRDLGLRVTLAGCGGRGSSFAILRHLPADGIEIASELVEGYRERPTDATILKTIVDLALKLGLEVGMAGVDRPGLAREFKDLGCDWASGAWVGAPLPASAFSEWLSGGGTLMSAAS